MSGKTLNFHDASQMKDFIVPEEIKEGEPYIPERGPHIMHDYLPDEVKYGEGRKF